jgi:hypothetical protein
VFFAIGRLTASLKGNIKIGGGKIAATNGQCEIRQNGSDEISNQRLINSPIAIIASDSRRQRLLAQSYMGAYLMSVRCLSLRQLSALYRWRGFRLFLEFRLMAFEPFFAATAKYLLKVQRNRRNKLWR